MEIWKDVPDFNGYYQVSNVGRVKSLPRIVKSPIKHNSYVMRKGGILSLAKSGSGYLTVTVFANNLHRRFRINRIVAMAFIENPNKYNQVNHINGIKTDNRVENLEWCNASMNRQHAYDTGLQSAVGQKNGHAKLTQLEVDIIRQKSRQGVTQQKLADIFEVARANISRIVNNKNWPVYD